MIVITTLQRDWVLNHWDIGQAFIQSKIDREVFMTLPDGCGEFSGRVVKLNKSLYGLRQSPRVFNQLLMSKLTPFNIKRCASDPCIFRFTSLDGKEVRVVVVV